MGYRLNRLDEPVFMAVPKPMLTEFGIHYRLESCALLQVIMNVQTSVDLREKSVDGIFSPISNLLLN